MKLNKNEAYDILKRVKQRGTEKDGLGGMTGIRNINPKYTVSHPINTTSKKKITLKV